VPARTIKTRIAVGGAAAVQYAQIRVPQDDPYTYFDNGDKSAVLCATAIEYGLIAA
jgi:hypothetical protein